MAHSFGGKGPEKVSLLNTIFLMPVAVVGHSRCQPAQYQPEETTLHTSKRQKEHIFTICYQQPLYGPLFSVLQAYSYPQPQA